ncbi:MAG: hypothetical protein K8R73_05665 [Clostridiales bacterium]|nr:hypothetical protein [Clostridiales bacterium]
MIRVNEIKFKLGEPLVHAAIVKKLSVKLKIKKEQIIKYNIIRESIDARKDVVFSYTIDVDLTDEKDCIKRGFKQAPPPFLSVEKSLTNKQLNDLKEMQRPIVIGFGPAGIFAALQFARAGLRPLVLEQGEDVDSRTLTVEKFWETGELNTRSNVQFGEGGAGTFSDGKLTTRIKDPRIEMVMDVLVKNGAPQNIIYKNKPHIGTDLLKKTVKNIRLEIETLGGEIRFNTEVIDLLISEIDHSIKGVACSDGTTFESSYVVAAVGHSSRKFYELLKSKNTTMERKPFAIGLRIEHPQVIINASQYGNNHVHDDLGAAEYKLTYRTSKGRSVYSFCMCPGGEVVASASEEGRLVVNGMSYYKRDLYNANSALLVNIDPSDLDGDSVLEGIEFQRRLEEMAYKAGGSDYNAPSETVANFCGQHQSLSDVKTIYAKLGVDYDRAFDDMKSTYKPGVKSANLSEVLPDFVFDALEEAIPKFGQMIKGFNDPRAILTGVESRSSAPVRIVRDSETMRSLSHKGLYPSGEGAGYSGGITSSAVDGIKVAEQIIIEMLK